MAKRVGIISINLQAGQAQFNADMGKAKASVVSFGQAAKAAGAAHAAASHTTVSGMQASSAAIRVMEGGMTNNLRAVERFVAGTLKLGPVLQTAFPLIGGLAFIGLMTKMATEAFNFFAKMSEGPARVAKAFRELNAPLKATVDDLRIAKDQLEIDIAKLEGKPKNNLQLALDEARKTADALAASLEKDIAAYAELQKTEGIGAVMGFLKRKAPTSDDEKRVAEFAAEQSEIDRRGKNAVDAAAIAKDKDAAAAAMKEWNKETLDHLDAEIKKWQGMVADTQKLQDAYSGKGKAPTREDFFNDISNFEEGRTKKLMYNGLYTPNPLARDPSTQLNERQSFLSTLNDSKAQYSLGADIAVLGNHKRDLDGNAAGKERAPHEDEALRRSQEETNRLIRELASATEKNLDAFEAIKLKQQEMLREASEAITVKGALGPGIVPQNQIDLIQQTTDQARLTEYGKEYAQTIEEKAKLLADQTKILDDAMALLDKSQKESADEASRTALRIGDIQRTSALGASTRQAGLADRMAELGGGTAESKINSAYERRIELANQFGASQNAQLAQEFAGQLSQKQSDELHEKQLEVQAEVYKATDEARIERELKLAELRQAQIKELTSPAISALSGQLANLATGKKTSFGKSFESAGHSMVEGSFGKALNFGVGKLFKGLGKNDGQSQPTALWVQVVAGAAGATEPGGAFARLPSMPAMPFGSPSSAPAGGPAAAAPSFLRSLAGAFGFGGLFGGGGGSTPSVSSSVSYMAGGGDMSADKAYITGENGPEIMSGINAHVTSNSDSRKLLGGSGGDTHNYTIDARGTDPVQTEERVRTAIMAAHNSAVSTSQQVSADRVRRTTTRPSR